MCLLSQSKRVKPTAANLRSLWGNFGAWGKTNVERRFGHRLNEVVSEQRRKKKKNSNLLCLDPLDSCDKIVRRHACDIDGHSEEYKTSEQVRIFVGFAGLHPC